MRFLLLITLLLPVVSLADPLLEYRVGDTWTYRLNGGDTDTMTNKVEGKQTLNGRTWYRLREFGYTFWVANGDAGQIEATNYFNKEMDPSGKAEIALVYKYPAEVGDTWNNQGSPATYQGENVVSVPAGRFRCHEYRIDLGEGSYSRSCIAPGVGLVRNTFSVSGKEPVLAELVEMER